MTYRSLIPLALLLFFCAQTIARGQSADSGGRSAGMAGAGVAIGAQPWTTNNPAAIGEFASRALAVQTSQGYGIAELRQGGLTIVWPTKAASIALEGHTFGFDAFRTTTAGITAARRITDFGGGLVGGVTVALHNLSIDGFGSTSAIGVNVGWILTPRPGLSVGGSIDNVLAGTWVPEEELRQVLRVGLAYLTTDVSLALDIEKDQFTNASARLGVEFSVMDAFQVRSGAATAPTCIALGAGVKIASIEVHLASERHQILGWTPAVALAVSF